MNKKNVANGLLWAGFALILLSVISCGAGCASGMAAIAGEGEIDDTANLVGAGTWMFILGFLLAIAGAIGKAIKSFRS